MPVAVNTAISQKESDVSFAYEVIRGIFLQDDPETKPDSFDYAASNLGLITRKYPTDPDDDDDDDESSNDKSQWQRFERYVCHLNKESPAGISYRVLYMGRHGEGYHNVAEAFYGTPAWDCHWSMLDGNGSMSWSDARLTPKGVDQARAAHSFWSSHIATQRIPTPETFYVSPLSRCLETAFHTFHGLSLPEKRPFAPVIKELLREGIGIHTCDRRRDKSHIHTDFPWATFESGFSESDPYWRPDERESSSAHVVRMKKLLDDVFAHDQSTFISFSSHGGSIRSILDAINHREFSLSTGAVIPVLLKVDSTKDPSPLPIAQPPLPPPKCDP